MIVAHEPQPEVAAEVVEDELVDELAAEEGVDVEFVVLGPGENEV